MTLTELKKSSMTTHTTKELLSSEQARQDYPLIRRLAGEVLNPGKTKHKYVYQEECGKCGVRCWDRLRNCALPALDDPCIPDPATGSMPDIAEQLVKKCEGNDLAYATRKFYEARGMHYSLWASTNEWRLLVYATPAERCVCCMAVLMPGQVKVTE